MYSSRNHNYIKRRKRLRYALVAFLLASTVCLVMFWPHKGLLVRSKAQKNNNSYTNVKYTHLDISLKNGQALPAASTYAVRSGANLEFSIASDQLGRIGFPSIPPQIINMTQSPIIVRFTAQQAGSYKLTYQQPEHTDAAVIGIIEVSP